MLLTTFPFLVFFIIVCILYWKVPKKGQWILLLLASYYFFGFWEPAFTGLIILTTVINYFAALFIHQSPRHKKIYFILAILADLGILFVFKYFNFFSYSLDQVFSLMSIDVHIPRFKLLLPVGISFYTFQTLGYLIDVYRGNIVPEKHPGYFALFVCFFPQLSAGPIERAEELLAQLKQHHRFNYQQAVSGIMLFVFGLFKKIVIADNLGILVDRVFASLPAYKGFSLLLTVVFFSWQLYADFSGYTDMSRGIARILGFNLVENFNAPYLATSLRDFWRRWHMSLSRWFKDYLYIPLGGSRKGIARTCFNGVVVFTLCGLWHGASWNFVLWGMFHGLVMSAERVIGTLTGNRIRVPVILKILYTYVIVCISWVLFRANTLSDALYIFRFAFTGVKNIILPGYILATLNQLFRQNSLEIIITFSLLLTAISIELISRIAAPDRVIRKQPVLIRYALYVLLVLLIIHLRNAEIKQFIYTRF